MGLIHIDLFTTLDGVAQAPGGPDEDTENDFAFGGWQAPLIDPVVGAQIWEGMQGMDALLLGRRTYDIFAAYWPNQQGDIADLFNRLPKYVASRHALNPAWARSSLLGENTVDAVHELKQRHDEVHVIGSLDFVQTLLAEKLFDRLTLWVHPIVLGEGKKIFEYGTVPTNLRLLEPVVASPKGSLLVRYERLDGTPAVGDMDVVDREH
ncbi:dihydrofolate reductase family protein [Lysinibacter cavernae]|uniref:Dihydrofolate reductase n=1 Tax=Lysinibacter cavernae TaxID=1640652 RepID=A0A7X5QYB1_9MICO|nr:dihydrofolate reductase family protein [Lysinibacter cavernae]NIH52173.1 dihydrofolate reductase [Lysinibacter cavernae]